MDLLFYQFVAALLMGLIGAIVFACLGVISGTDEAATLTPLTLLVVLLGVPPAGCFTFFMAGAFAKHMTHAIPTTLLGIPGDAMAAPLLQQAVMLRALGVPHIALRKMLSGGIVAGVVAVPLAVIFATLLAPFGASIAKAAPWVFLFAAVAIAYHTAGRWSSVLLLVPFVLLIVGLRTLTEKYGVKLTISYYLGIATGPLIADLFAILSPIERRKMHRSRVSTFSLAPDVKAWGGYFPNPLRVLDQQQTVWTMVTAAVSSATFVFSPIAMTVILGELVGAHQAFLRTLDDSDRRAKRRH
jgi:putative tricarboxylic transport membrane protein